MVLDNIMIEEVESISLSRDGTASIFFGSRAAGGMINILLKDPLKRPSAPARGIITYSPIGYAKAVEFFAPVYDTPEKVDSPAYDLRTTLFWCPSLHFNSEGVSTVSYYTADSAAPQRLIVEGVTSTGVPVRKEMLFSGE
jgi:hypothetical protein